MADQKSLRFIGLGFSALTVAVALVATITVLNAATGMF